MLSFLKDIFHWLMVIPRVGVICHIHPKHEKFVSGKDGDPSLALLQQDEHCSSGLPVRISGTNLNRRSVDLIHSTSYCAAMRLRIVRVRG